MEKKLGLSLMEIEGNIHIIVGDRNHYRGQEKNLRDGAVPVGINGKFLGGQMTLLLLQQTIWILCSSLSLNPPEFVLKTYDINLLCVIFANEEAPVTGLVVQQIYMKKPYFLVRLEKLIKSYVLQMKRRMTLRCHRCYFAWNAAPQDEFRPLKCDSEVEDLYGKIGSDPAYKEIENSRDLNHTFAEALTTLFCPNESDCPDLPSKKLKRSLCKHKMCLLISQNPEEAFQVLLMELLGFDPKNVLLVELLGIGLDKVPWHVSCSMKRGALVAFAFVPARVRKKRANILRVLMSFVVENYAAEIKVNCF
ncbi:hypothetical protein Salat_1556100 [Sesamum alatum]|uniref:Uncharacterized protein n=1 Tax=Sesamum alatum TaxID=300844 RepID=A0AAE1YCQ5_9LAMI|nr:hypothetical protein Salat_1556100 [Sesamum alatum]